MNWLAERRRTLCRASKNVKTFEEFILNSSIVDTIYAYSAYVTFPIVTENCTKYVFAIGSENGHISISKVTNGYVTELFSSNSTYSPSVAMSGTSAITFSRFCVAVVIDPLDLNTVSCDEILRSAFYITGDGKNGQSGNTACITNPYRKGAKYVIAIWNADGSKIVRVDSDTSFTTLAVYGNVTNLLTGVHITNLSTSSQGDWYVYCYDDDHTGVSNDTYVEGITALDFDE